MDSKYPYSLAVFSFPDDPKEALNLSVPMNGLMLSQNFSLLTFHPIEPDGKKPVLFSCGNLDVISILPLISNRYFSLISYFIL